MVEYDCTIPFISFAHRVIEAYEEAYGKLRVPVSFREEIRENDSASLDLYSTRSSTYSSGTKERRIKGSSSRGGLEGRQNPRYGSEPLKINENEGEGFEISYHYAGREALRGSMRRGSEAMAIERPVEAESASIT